MCFSATASFTAGTALVAVGAVTVRRSQGVRELPLALIPLLFGVQQLSEGVLWLTLGNDMPTLQSRATNVFSFFSHVFWPVFVPLAFLLVETNRWRRRVLTGFLSVGTMVGLYLLVFLFREPITASMQGRRISYDSPHFYIGVVLVLYLLATCASGMFSSYRCVNVFGILAFSLAIAAYEISARTFVSVWCFFAAVLSLLILIHFSGPMLAARSGHGRNPPLIPAG